MTRSFWCAVIAVLGVTAPLSAQTFQVGIGGGITSSSFWGEDAGGADWKVGLAGSVHIVVQPHPVIGFETGASYVQKGARERSGSTTAKVTLPYIEIPAFLRIALPLEGTSLTPVLLGGGALGINMGCSLSGTDSGFSLDLECDSPLLDDPIDIEKLDVGVGGGLALDVPIGGSVTLSPSARYILGMAPLDNIRNAPDTKNSSFTFQLSVRFH